MNSWNNFLHLFSGDKSSPRHFTLLGKRGRFALYLPLDGRIANSVLQLYPAQRPFARILLGVVRGLTRCGIPVSRQKAGIPIDDTTAFSRFLSRVVPGTVSVPIFGILSNKLTEPGRTYVLLLFDTSARPAAVVKVGTTEKARKLIQVEQKLFFPKPPHFACMPEAVDLYEGADAHAIAYRFVEGSSVRDNQHEKIESVLNSWIQEDEVLGLTDLSVWPQLATMLRGHPGLESIFEILQRCRFKPVLAHGDFTPWNIRVKPDGEWIVLDWERCTQRGIPGWDWLNFILQYHIRIRRATADVTLSAIEALWESPAFQSYAKRTGISLVCKELTFVYLFYFLFYAGPPVRIRPIHAFFDAFKRKYFPGVPLSKPLLKVSVVTPSYKQLPWLKLCVASVGDQKGVEVEHIIQDAQSGPELTDWIRTNSKAQLYVEADSGMYDAINRGFARTTGDIVCWLNSDEQYLEGALAKVASFFDTHPEVDVLFGDALLVGNNGTVLSYRRTILPTIAHVQLSHLNTLSCATFVRRSVIEQGYLLDDRLKAIADAVWVVSFLKNKISMAVLKEPLAIFTLTDMNLGQSSLALAEAARWKNEIPGARRLLRPLYILKHRLSKLAQGAYWPRSITTRFYTLSSNNQRIIRKVSRTGFRWPGKA